MDRIKVLTLNTWNCEGPYKDREPLIKSWIEKLEPDLIGLQEVEVEQTADLLGAFGYQYEWAGHGESGIAVAAKWELVNCIQYDLPGVEKESVGGNLLGCHVRAPFGTVPFVNATSYFYLPHDGWKREFQMPLLYDIVKTFRIHDGFPTILVGDFNTVPDSAEMRYMRGLQSISGHSTYFCDAWERGGDGTPGTTWSTRNPYARPWGLPDVRIDYIFVGCPGVLGPGAVLSCRVVCDEPVNGVWPSDHFGVYAELGIK
jgi:endonuclease/exonuclease/phosphatase family metal-dependent hydrolase